MGRKNKQFKNKNTANLKIVEKEKKMVKLQLDEIINDLDGEPLVMGEQKLSYRNIFCQALLGVKDQNLSHKDKLYLGNFARQVKNCPNPEIELHEKNIQDLLNIIGSIQDVLIVLLATEHINKCVEESKKRFKSDCEIAEDLADSKEIKMVMPFLSVQKKDEET